MGVCGFGRFDDLFIRGIQTAVPDIFHNGSLKQPGVLKYHAENLTQLAAVEIAYIGAIHQDSAAVHIVKTHQKLHHSGFSCAGRPYDGYGLAGLHGTVKVMDNNFIRIITEYYVLEVNSALREFQMDRVLHILYLFFLFQEFKNTFCGSSS